MSKSNQVSFKIDSRLFYTLIAILAVVGIFGIGMWIGQQVTGSPSETTAGTTDQASTSSGVAQAPVVPQPGLDTGAVISATTPAEQAKGQPPVSVEEQAVGSNEARLAIEEINKDNNYTFHMGTVPADKKTENEFTLKNVGTSELVIESTSASCGCTAAVADKKELKPGESTLLHVGYDPRVNQDFGKYVQKQIRIKSNDPVVPLIEFTITADVEAQ